MKKVDHKVITNRIIKEVIDEVKSSIPEDCRKLLTPEVVLYTFKLQFKMVTLCMVKNFSVYLKHIGIFVPYSKNPKFVKYNSKDIDVEIDKVKRETFSELVVKEEKPKLKRGDRSIKMTIAKKFKGFK